MANETTTAVTPTPIELASFGITLNSPDNLTSDVVSGLEAHLSPEFKQLASNLQALGQEFKQLKQSGLIPEGVSFGTMYDQLSKASRGINDGVAPWTNAALSKARTMPVLGGMIGFSQDTARVGSFVGNTFSGAVATAKLPFQLLGDAARDIGAWFDSGAMDSDRARNFAVLLAATQQDAYHAQADGYEPGFTSSPVAYVTSYASHWFSKILAWPGLHQAASAVMAAWNMAASYLGDGPRLGWKEAYAQASATLRNNAATVESPQDMIAASVEEGFRSNARTQAAQKMRGFFGSDSPEAQLSALVASGGAAETTRGTQNVGTDGRVAAENGQASSGSHTVDRMQNFRREYLPSFETASATALGGTGVYMLGKRYAPGALEAAGSTVRSTVGGVVRTTTGVATGLTSGVLQGTAGLSEAHAHVFSNDATKAVDAELKLGDRQASAMHAGNRVSQLNGELQTTRNQIEAFEERFKNSSRTASPDEQRELRNLRRTESRLQREVTGLGKDFDRATAEINDPQRRFLRANQPGLLERAETARATAGTQGASASRLRGAASALEHAAETRVGASMVSGSASSARSLGRFIGRRAPVVLAATSAYDTITSISDLTDNDPTNDRDAARSAVSAGTNLGFAGAGAAVGVWFGGVGALPGAAIGGLVGAGVDYFAGDKVTDAIMGPDGKPVQQLTPEQQAQLQALAQAGREAEARAQAARDQARLAAGQLQINRPVAHIGAVGEGDNLRPSDAPNAADTMRGLGLLPPRN